MPCKVDLTGRRFGLLLVERFVGRNQKRTALWQCACDCGGSAIITLDNLASGNTVSCGCYRRALLQCLAVHGHNRVGQRSPEYQSWSSMIARVSATTGQRFDNYGARGITVCSQWAGSFQLFLTDMGPRPFGTSLDRINNDGNYEPGNCRWATASQQVTNRRYLGRKKSTINPELAGHPTSEAGSREESRT